MQEKTFNAFEELKVFENQRLNKLCDTLTEKVKEITQSELVVCGSVARLLAEKLPEQYLPKDIDFMVNPIVFRRLLLERFDLDYVLMVEKSPKRIILYTDDDFCIEIWTHFPHMKYEEKKYYQQKIPYQINITPWQKK